MPVVTSGAIDGGAAEVDFTVNASNVVTGITIRNTLPGRSVRVFIHHAGSGYLYEDPTTPGLGRLQVFGGAPITINLPNNRRFPNDGTAVVSVRGA